MPRARAGSAAAAAVLVGVLAVACTPSDESEPSSGPDGVPEVALSVTTEGKGRLSDDALAEMEAEVSDVLAGYVVKGFLGDYPRDDFVDGFADFSSRATQFAAADIDVLTGSRFEEASAVTATALDARLYFLVRERVVVGASAYVDFDFDVDDGGRARTASLRGRLTLGRSDDGWQIYGYDVLRDDSDALPAEASL